MNKKFLTGLALGLVFAASFGLTRPAAACVGKTLVIGSTGTVQQDVLAQMLAILISERTGTTVKVVRFDSSSAAHQALLKDDLDLYVEYTGVGQVEILGAEPLTDPEELYQAVKERYTRELNLVWLTPLGFEEPGAVATALPAQAAPVVRKDTLKKFPALARLINKLGGAIDQQAILRLETRAAGEPPRDVAREFLKQGRFI